MNLLVMAGQLILALAILVTLHEWGHYITARIFGMRVEKFYLFFDAWGIKLFKFKRNDTEFGVGWLPLGGYVKIAGMIDESMDKEAMKKPPESWEFRSKPAWQRLIVMLGGIIMNLILGVVIFTFSHLFFAEGYVPMSEVNKDGIYAHALAQATGLKTGDKVLKIDGEKFVRFNDLVSPTVLLGSTLTVDRDGEVMDVVITDTVFSAISASQKKALRPLFISNKNHPLIIDSVMKADEGEIKLVAERSGMKKGDQVVSIGGKAIHLNAELTEACHEFAGDSVDVVVNRGGQELALHGRFDSTGYFGVFTHPRYDTVPYTFASAFMYGTTDAFENIWVNARGFGKIFSGKVSASDSVQGPLGIAKMFGGEWIWKKFWGLTAMLSMILAFVNILPIPALDGGHAMFLTIEIVSGKKFSDKFMEKVQLVGMIILLALMAYVISNDIINLF